MTPRKIPTLGPEDILRSRYISERAPSSYRMAAEAAPGAETENDERVGMTDVRENERMPAAEETSPLIYRHFLWTHIAHWRQVKSTTRTSLLFSRFGPMEHN